MEQIFQKPIKDLILQRHSVRGYEKKDMSETQKQKLIEYLAQINKAEGIFGGKVRVELVQKDYGNQSVKLGTYGMIQGANDYLVVACPNSEYDYEDLGFLFEKVVLFCTSIGLGTVWMGGTFRKGNFAKAIHLTDSERLPIVSPVGIENSKKSIIAKVVGSKHDKRKAFGELFFQTDFDKPLQIEDALEYADVLEMVRLAPSAMNSQPWRILKEGNQFHFYSEGKIDMNRIDMGICLCHFYLSAKEKGLEGKFQILEGKNQSNIKYLISWISE